MEGYKFLKPASKGLIIRDPNSKQPLNPDGELKAWVGSEGTYWRRRVNDGTCVIVENEKEKEEIKFDEKNNIIKRGLK